MILTKEQIAEIEKLSEPLVKFMNNNFHPHTFILVETSAVTVGEESARVPITKFIKD